MDAFSPNPNADADQGFDIAQPGIYRMRIEGSPKFPGVQDFVAKSGNRCLKVRLVFSDAPSTISTINGVQAKNLGSVIDQSCVLEPAEKQGKTRGLVEACGIPWLEFTNLQMLNGREVFAKLELEEYNGEKRNKVTRYVKNVNSI